MTASYFVALTLPQIESCSISAVFLLYGAVRSRIVLKFSHLTCMVSMAYNLTMVTSCIVFKIKRKRDIGRKHIFFIPASNLTCMKPLIHPNLIQTFHVPTSYSTVQRYCRKVSLDKWHHAALYEAVRRAAYGATRRHRTVRRTAMHLR